MHLQEGRRRVIIDHVSPAINGGRFAIKRTVGEQVVVEADAFTDGHDAMSLVLLYRKQGVAEWSETPMEFLVNDRWRGAFVVTEMGYHCYTVCGWVDHFKSWARDLKKRVDAGQDVTLDLVIGAQYVEAAVPHAAGADADTLAAAAATLRTGGEAAIQQGLAPELADLMYRYAERRYATVYDHELPLFVDRERARYSSWYELFPRSCSPVPGQHGTFRDCAERLPYVAEMGFDVLYLPPIHPIGRVKRKGKNNSVVAGPDDVGSCWAIGAEEGGHKAIHPQLGTLDDFKFLVAKAREYGMKLHWI